MSEIEGPFPNWDKTVSREEFLRMSLALRAEVVALAGVITAMRRNDEKMASERMDAYFKATERLTVLLDDILQGDA